MSGVIPQRRPQILLATCRDLPYGEPGHSTLTAALAKRGIDAEWRIWNDPDVDWAKADLVAVRSTWDYQDRLLEFLAWAKSIGSKLLHGVDTFRWNTDKCYLLELEAAGVPIVPADHVPTLTALLDTVHRKTGTQIVKTALGASGIGVEIIEEVDYLSWTPTSPGPWVVQPFVESVKTEGETTVFMINGVLTAQFAKTPANGEFRVHEEYGGHAKRVYPLTFEAECIAHQAYVATEAALQVKLNYAGIDLLRYNGRLVVSEVEITEPQFYFDIMPEHADLFADMLAGALVRCRLSGANDLPGVVYHRKHRSLLSLKTKLLFSFNQFQRKTATPTT